ncbi:hypothetical protein NI77_10605 [Listeria monocytogenes]|uniref:hypothetical protein n=1 Tax=Listeria TaxID=1637 RepID=UPI000E3DE446|nr:MULTISPECIES: hypothetical protein [Listeria]EAC2738446.1 hypothetical protein [Listeria monocytogenes]EAD0206953.1 hypothetical protein [Listeria monocytogenes]EAD0226320.1 hypothetical protein [Listeria monocytogenes]EAD7622598.1 hypothetical protein [Listeria monocytogenes]EAF1366681.1 hypothetical protein [Listeria monocytogenes]
MSVDFEEVLGQMQQAVNEKLGITLDETQPTLADVVDMLNDQKVTIGGDTMTEPLFGSLRTGILNELYEAENDYLERIKEKDARIEELESEIDRRKKNLTVDVKLTDELRKHIDDVISQYREQPTTFKKELPNPGLIVYEGKTYRKTERDPQEGDVVIITYFDDVAGTWIRRVQERGRISSDGFYLNSSINHETYFYIDDDKIAAVYAPFNEGTTYA